MQIRDRLTIIASHTAHELVAPFAEQSGQLLTQIINATTLELGQEIIAPGRMVILVRVMERRTHGG